ncbi:MAG: biopolymer transporter ExbD [Verrucomicrobiaceae bacterium]|nr:biopolymer transporter ExbD [Verrucomicrobiaceae bacterium]
MKIASPLPQKKARLEIIPLIDIMFFLLASFMLVSLSMTKQRTVSVNLPAAASGQTNLKPDNISLAVKADGQLFIEKQAITLEALEPMLKDKLKVNKDLPVFISGDAATPHGAMIAVLDYVRRCGVTKVAFSVKAPAP